MSLLESSKKAVFPFVAQGLMLALLPIGCDSKDAKRAPKDDAAGAAGTSSTTQPQAGATTTSAGASTATGGDASASGGVVATAGSSSVGEGGATTTLPSVSCISDLDCKPLQLLCNKTAQKCVQCLASTDCTDGKACIAGLCQSGCASNADCANSASGKLCDVSAGQCVACLAASDCPNPATSDCVAHACVAVVTCTNSLACTSATAPICNRTTSRCVECVEAADCAASGKANAICAANSCQSPCSASADCAAPAKLCNTTAVPAICVECMTNADCATSKLCSAGKCATGSGICAEKTAKPCDSIGMFAGVQAVDGNGDDFCNVPAFELAFDKSAAKVNPAEGEAAGATYPERATYRVAWTANALHAYIEVVDPSVNPNTNPGDIWNGDGVELMISTSRSVTGLTSADANTLHVIANSVIAVTVKASGESGSHTLITDASLFKAQKTAQGYAVELKMPWPMNANVAAGAQIYFDAALNSARAGTDGAPRNAQAILFQLPNPVTTSCTGTGTAIAPFCDDRLWCPTKLQ